MFIAEPMEQSCHLARKTSECEQNSSTLIKLDILDFGKVTLDDGMIGRVFFLGKVIVDQHDTHTFIHLFTMVFENTSATQKQIIAHSKMRSSV